MAVRTALTVSQGHWRNPGSQRWDRSKKTLITDCSTNLSPLGSVESVEGRSKILGWVVAALVIVLAVLTVIIVRSSAQPEPPDLTPVEVTPGSSATSDADGSQGTGDSAGQPSQPSGSSEPTKPSEPSGSSSDQSSVPDELEHSYEPVPNPPREVPDDDGDDDDDDDDDGDDDGGDDDD